MKRRDTLALAGALALPSMPAAASPETGRRGGGADGKVLRIAFPISETGFDPARLSDLYSLTVTAHIFDAPLDFDHLARPVKLRPRVAMSLPEHSDDFRVWTIRLRLGVYFADDPAFRGQRRELKAQDFVYTLKRFADPSIRSPNWTTIEELGFVGLDVLREKSRKSSAPFDYDTEIPGLRAMDRYTFQCRLSRSNPRFAESLADSGLVGAVAREVVEYYGDRIVENPVGTGPFRLASWRRSSQMVLERNPNFREAYWEAEPAPDDAEGQAMLKRLTGRRLPLVDRVEVQVIESAQPRYLSFVNGQLDHLALPQEFVPAAMPGGKLAPYLRDRGILAWRTLLPTVQAFYFNMEHPVVGGLAPHKVALRRAIWLGIDIKALISGAYRNQALQAQSLVVPFTRGYEPLFFSEGGEYSVARARALLDMYGYVDKDGDGWREQPDGQPLLLESATEPDSLSRQIDEMIKRNMDALGVRIVFRPADRTANFKAARAGRLMMWRINLAGSRTDSQELLQCLYGPQAGGANWARFRRPEFDAVYEQLLHMQDGPERQALLNKAKRMAIAYAPYKACIHHYADVLVQPWLDGFRRPVFWNHWWHLVDIDMARRPAAA